MNNASLMKLLDYANRQWNGLMRDYYLPRWRMLIEATLAELKGGKAIDRAALETKRRAHEIQFATNTSGNYAHQPGGNCFSMSRTLFKKYSGLVQNSAASPHL